jgi:site-specific DNA recombinase
LLVSDEDKQTPERSFAMQRQRIQEQLLAPSSISMVQEYRDVLTGTNPNRADYQKMLADAKAGKFSHLGLYRADRFGRNAAEGLQAATRLIGMGIKLRVANMPTLTPEEPDGFFMFLIQMGLAQREVDVLKQRTADGMEAKLRAGGWPYKAPEGYINKERQISSNKYERWVEQDPESIQMFRQAWDLLLTDRHSMAEICEDLHARGFARQGGRPWAWDDPKRKIRVRAKNRLHQIFHNPFYAGWVVSERFGIKNYEIRGQWKPIITTEEFQRGIEILRKHDLEKSRKKKRHYLLRNLLWVRTNGQTYKLYGSSPKPRKRYYAYYITHAKPNGLQIRVPCELIDDRISGWLEGIQVKGELLPEIQATYQAEIQQAISENRSEKESNLKRRISQLQDEEARLGRLFMTGR